MLIADFSNGLESITVEGLWEYDVNQKLKIVGLDLPEVCQISFSNKEKDGSSIPMDGVKTEDGSTMVSIPNSLLWIDTRKRFYVFAFIYVTSEDEGETIRKIKMPVTPRPKMDGVDVPIDISPFTEAIDTIRQYFEQIYAIGDEIANKKDYIDNAIQEINALHNSADEKFQEYIKEFQQLADDQAERLKHVLTFVYAEETLKIVGGE